ncbi:hypothetical protein A2764_01885 [Candidatus Kaiserbacteria bacterium RIFCSPHIGHO2_01_FULL_55_79]|nr:MAG: hypothetical protein A2764_01885 [Candidatus Kaiserbacteria bacterium RIFCSPHIGHO2_01_FULL_55_79]OGG78106.1 MAG: hypothetical protein A3F56_03625 [Candidatus Kaiserbacteria bacterium RIFCSPHIGHO2_12_FULL_55_13]OGG83928.1 MAG: hypothetical protein A3A42_00325 [Candidatus Kaiserbacteria bacterium RIFCSPLOWO2_01_FULL_55_25]
MLKKIAFAGVGIALLASPLLASADTLSDLQTQIAGLLGQLKQLQTQLGQTQGANPTTNSGGGVGIAVPASLYPVDPISICPAFRRVLVYGVRGDDVVQLQKFLVAQGLLSDDSATGFFGRMTEAAVQKLQAANGIVSSGDHATTGWGAIGPATRAWIARWCNGNSRNFSASPRSGPAPLAVSFSAWGGKDDDYSIDFGDSSNGAMTRGPMAACAESQSYPTNVRCGKYSYSTSHTYTANGTYTAKLMYQPPAPPCNAPEGAACTMVLPPSRVVGTVTIRVGVEAPSCPIYSPPLCNANEQLVAGDIGSDGCQRGPRCVPKTPTSGAPVINGIDGPASLAVGQQGTWTVHASVANGGNTNLRYSVIWGDDGVLDQLNAFAGNTTSALQTSGSFTHAYANAGTYRPTFTVSNSAGSAQTSASVRVGGSDDDDGGGGSDTFSASPTSGTAPLAVIFRSNIVNGLDAYTINFGDGTNGNWQNNCQTGYGACGLPTATHTYTANGTYAATLYQHIGGPSGPDQLVGTVTITVGGGSTSSGTFTATPKTGAPPLMVTFTGVGNNISFGDEGPTFIASGNGSLGTMTHVYRSGGEYTATSDGRSVNISVTPDKLADWRSAFGGANASSNLCVYNNRTYQSGTSADVPVWSCGTFADYRKCGGAIAQGATGPIITEKYSCRSGQWFDSNNIPLESELVNATSCLASDGVTAVGNGQFIAYGLGAIGFADLNTFGRRIPTMKCDNGKWLSCDAYGNNCTQASADTNANLASALSALESALKALIGKLGQ